MRTAEGHNAEAKMERDKRFILNAFRKRKCALLFINSTVTVIILHSRACYFFDSNSRDSRVSKYQISHQFIKVWKYSTVRKLHSGC